MSGLNQSLAHCPVFGVHRPPPTAGLPAEDRRIIGEDIKTVEFGWHVGMPVVRPLGDKLYEVRSVLTNGDESREQSGSRTIGVRS